MQHSSIGLGSKSTTIPTENTAQQNLITKRHYRSQTMFHMLEIILRSHIYFSLFPYRFMMFTTILGSLELLQYFNFNMQNPSCRLITSKNFKLYLSGVFLNYYTPTHLRQS